MVILASGFVLVIRLIDRRAQVMTTHWLIFNYSQQVPQVSWLCCETSMDYLNACLGQFQLHGQMFARKDVRILALVESLLQLVQLVRGEGGARSACVGRMGEFCDFIHSDIPCGCGCVCCASQCNICQFLPSNLARPLVWILLDAVGAVIIVALHIDAGLLVVGLRCQAHGAIFHSCNSQKSTF